MTGLEPRKLFVGGLPRSVVTPDGLRAHFARYGEVVDAVAMLNPIDGLGRGFGFVEFADEAAVRRALDWKEMDKHVFHGRRVDVKRAQTRAWQTQRTSYNPIADSKKIFVGGLRDNVTQDDLMVYFQKFGTINDVVVMYERITRKPRGFGFVTFDSQEAVDKVLENQFHDLNGTKVETKMAEPREHNQYRNGHYHGSVTRGHMSPARIYGGIYSPHNIPYHYMVPAYPYMYPPHGIVNYGYMMNHTTTSNDAGVMAMQGSPMMYADYGRSYVYDSLSTNYLGQVNGNRQRVDISAPTGKKSDLVIPDSDNLL